MPHDDGSEYRFLVKGKLVLAQNGDPFPGPDTDLPLVGLELPREEL